MQNMKFRGFVRVFLLGSLAMCGLEVFASGILTGRPNPLEGGRTFYYPDVAGNTTNNPANILGHIQNRTEDYEPQYKAGANNTNVIYLARGDQFSLSTKKFSFLGFDPSNNAEITAASGYDNYLLWTNEAGRVAFRASNSTPVNDSAALISNTVFYVNVKGEQDGNKRAVQVYFANRNDAYYRVPRSDTYYVPKGATLWFCKERGSYQGARWGVPDNVKLNEPEGYDESLSLTLTSARNCISRPPTALST